MTILSQTAHLLKSRLGNSWAKERVEDLVIGLFFTGVRLSCGAGGLCYTPVKEIPKAVCCPSSAGRVFDPRAVRGTRADVVLKEVTSQEPIKKAVSIATLNALSSLCWAEQGRNYKITLGRDALDFVRINPDSSVALVGAIVPALRLLKARRGNWWIIEQDPDVLKADELPHFVRWEDCQPILEKADVVIATGVTLVNDTLDTILRYARPDAEIGIIGPTASMLPDVLFGCGVRVVGGTWVKKSRELLKVLAAGGSGYHFLDKYADRVVLEKSSTNSRSRNHGRCRSLVQYCS